MLALLLALATQDLQVSAELDRDRIGVGDAITYTARVIVEPALPVRTVLPPFDGFTLIGRAERREPAGGAGHLEVVILELRLRAQRAGLWRIGGVRFEQGIRTAVSPEVEVAVEAGRLPGPAIGPRVQRLLARGTPPAGGEVGISLLVSDDTAMVGEQVDLVTAAWFPRELLGRLRRPPTIRPPTVEGVYTAIQPSTAGVASSRLVNGVWYDLYVAHQVLFPVDEGTVRIPSAGLSYSVPAGRQYFTDEKAFELSSPARVLVVRGLPPGGSGAVARNLGLSFELSPEPARAGQPIPVTVVVSGLGNLALWPSPAVTWPEGARGYPDGSTDRPRLAAGEFGGTKSFRFFVVVDSAGSVAVPDLRYRYYDLAQRGWRDATTRGVVIPVLSPAATVERRRPVPGLVREPVGLWVLSPPLAVALALLLLGPVLVIGADRFRRRPRREREPAPAGPPADQLVARIRAVVPDADARREERLAAALRVEGLDPRDSADAARLYAQLATRRFAPGGDAIADRLESVTRSLLSRWPHRLRRAALVLLLSTGWSRPTPAAPAPSPAALWAEGAAAYQNELDARAAALWIAARRLAPRNPVMADGWRRVAVRSADLQSAGRVSPLTPVEWLMVAGLGWALAWLTAWRGRRRVASGLAVATVIAALAAAAVATLYARPLAVVARASVIRQAPHGLASESGRADPLTVMEVIASRPGWRLVRSATGILGWVPETVLEEVRRLHWGA